jgi:hypothetical protein
MSGSGFSWRLLFFGLLCLLVFLFFVASARFAWGVNTLAQRQERGSTYYGPTHK